MHINDLMEYFDAEFVRQAYRALFHREADLDGLNHYTRQLRRGQPRIHILWQLAKSHEYVQDSVQGLKAELNKYEKDRKLSRTPVVGRLIRILFLKKYKRHTDVKFNIIENLVGTMASGQRIEPIVMKKNQNIVMIQSELSADAQEILQQLQSIIR